MQLTVFRSEAASASRRPRRGFQLLELALVLALAGLVTALTLPSLWRAAGGSRLRVAAAELTTVLRLARSEAIKRSAAVGVRFVVEPGVETRYTLYLDGDGDGVRRRDIESGVDRPLGPTRSMRHLGRGLTFGFPPGLPPRDPGSPNRRLDRLEDPIRFNRSDIASFGPLGTSTPGSLYLTDGADRLVVVRLLGRTGRARVLTYDRKAERWR